MIDQQNDIAIILLAAGASTRMGRSKQLLTIHQKPLLTTATQTALATKMKPVTVVLGAKEHEHREVIDTLPINIVVNHRWSSGMGSSIKAGLKTTLEKSPQTQAVIVMVCDQPYVSAAHLNTLAHEYIATHTSIVASFYQQSPGVPALFSKDHFHELLHLDDAHGAKKILLSHESTIKTISFPEGAIDLDTEADYNAFILK